MTSTTKISTRKEGASGIVDVAGDLTSAAEERLTQAFREPSLAGCKHIVFNFTQCAYINSSGISIIISLLGESRNTGRVVSVYGLTPHFSKIFNMVGLTQYLSVCASEEEALRAA